MAQSKQRAVLLVEGQQGRNAPSISLLLEALIPGPVLARMKEKQGAEIYPDWLFYEDLKDEGDAAYDARLDEVYAARAKSDQDTFVDVLEGIPTCYEVVMVVTCYPY